MLLMMMMMSDDERVIPARACFGAGLEQNDGIVGTYNVGDQVAITEGTHAGERGMVRSIRAGQLIVRLIGGGATSSFDAPCDANMVRKLTLVEVETFRVTDERKEAAEEAAAEMAVRGLGAPDEDEARYGEASQAAQLDARRQRRAERKAASDADEMPTGGVSAAAPQGERDRPPTPRFRINNHTLELRKKERREEEFRALFSQPSIAPPPLRARARA